MYNISDTYSFHTFNIKKLKKTILRQKRDEFIISIFSQKSITKVKFLNMTSNNCDTTITRTITVIEV